MKKALSVTLILLILSLLAIPAFAIEIFEEGDYNYAVEENGLYITIYHGDETDVTVPDKIAGQDVVGIKSTAFYDTRIKTVTLPESVTDIEDDAFLPAITVIQNKTVIIEPEQTVPVTEAVTSGGAAPDSGKTEDKTEGSDAAPADTKDGETVSDIPDGNKGGADVEIREGEEEISLLAPKTDNSVLVLTVILIVVSVVAVAVVVFVIVKSKKKN